MAGSSASLKAGTQIVEPVLISRPKACNSVVEIYRSDLFVSTPLFLMAVPAAVPADLFLNDLPPSIQAGAATTLKWQGGDSSESVTLTLMKGSLDNLETLFTITDQATGGSFVWTPPKDLPSASDYAIQISQGDNISDSGQFAIVGGPSDSSASSTTSLISNVGSIKSQQSLTGTDSPNTFKTSTASSNTPPSQSQASESSVTSITSTPSSASSTFVNGSSSKVTTSSPNSPSAKNTAISSSTVTASASRSSSSGLDTGQLVGIIIGVFAIAVLVTLLSTVFFRRHRRRRNAARDYDFTIEPDDITPGDVKEPAWELGAVTVEKDEKPGTDVAHIGFWEKDKKLDTSARLEELPADSHFPYSDTITAQSKPNELHGSPVQVIK